MTQTSETQIVQYDEQVTAFDEQAEGNQYAEVIVDHSELIELFSQGANAANVSVMLTPRAARQLAQRLLAAADIAEDYDPS